MTSRVPEDCATPIVVYSGDIYTTSKLEVFAEGNLIASPLDIMEAFEVLFCAHYVFNKEYNRKARDTLTFLQRGLFSILDKSKVSAIVRSLLNDIA